MHNILQMYPVYGLSGRRCACPVYLDNGEYALNG